MTTHKLRSFGASVLLVVVLAVLSYFLMQGRYDDLLNLYVTQGQRAYVIAFTDVFLYYLLSSDSLIVMLVITFILTFLLLKTWQDGLLSGLFSGIIVSLLALYIVKNYFPEALAAGGLATVFEKLWSGIVGGLTIGVAGAMGGFVKEVIIEKTHEADTTSLSAERKFYKCPKCGTEFESNPETCSNCGQRLRRPSERA